MTVRAPFLWLLTLILFVALLMQLARWKRTTETADRLTRTETASPAAEHRTWLDHVTGAENKQRRLEAQLLWDGRESLLPRLGELSQGLSLSLVGVEELPESRRDGYAFRPVHLSFTGDYAGYAMFLSAVERITPIVRIEEVRIYRRKRDHLLMSLTLAPMHRPSERESRDSSPVAISMPAVHTIAIDRSPFALSSSRDAAHNPEDAPLPQLTAVLWDEANPTAILQSGGAQLPASVGEIVAGATILSIRPEQVIVKRGLGRYALELWKQP